MSDFCILDNVINESAQDEIEEILSNKIFPWFYINGTVHPIVEGLIPQKNDVGFFNHKFIENNINFSAYSEKIVGLFKIHQHEINSRLQKKKFNQVNFDDVLRLQANFLPGDNSMLRKKTPFHVDCFSKHIVFIYYVNSTDTNSKTILKKKISVSPKRGRGLFFVGNILHRVKLPKNIRIVLNFNLNLIN